MNVMNPETRRRIDAIDLLRGLVMVIMMLERDSFFNCGHFSENFGVCWEICDQTAR